jgi:hypothetical protein
MTAGTSKYQCKLVKQLKLVFPMTEDNHYVDLPAATIKQALDNIIGIIKYQEESLELVGNGRMANPRQPGAQQLPLQFCVVEVEKHQGQSMSGFVRCILITPFGGNSS